MGECFADFCRIPVVRWNCYTHYCYYYLEIARKGMRNYHSYGISLQHPHDIYYRTKLAFVGSRTRRSSREPVKSKKRYSYCAARLLNSKRTRIRQQQTPPEISSTRDVVFSVLCVFSFWRYVSRILHACSARKYSTTTIMKNSWKI